MIGQQWKKFRAYFCEFVQLLVKQCKYSIIYNQYLMDKVVSLLIGPSRLASAHIQTHRHPRSNC